MTNDTLFVFAGELSGDSHGGDILQALKELAPSLTIRGVAGPHMRAVGMELVLPMEHFQVMGFTAVIAALPRLMRAFWKIKKEILTTNPKGVLLIDYPGFNMRLAKALRQAGYRGKIVHYVAPTVWAWGRHRTQALVDTLDALLAIFPFEPAFFASTPLPVAYTGNPSFDTVHDHRYVDNWKELVGIPTGLQLLAIFPGSRSKEVAHNLAKQLEVARRLCKEQPHLAIAVSVASDALGPVIIDSLNKSGFQAGNRAFIVPKEYNYELMKQSRAAIATSGTVTLELALHEVPTVVVYHVSWLNSLFARYYLKVNLPYYCLVNILQQADLLAKGLSEPAIYPELFAKYFSSDNLYAALAPLISDSPERHFCLSQLAAFRSVLSTSDSGRNAARVILNVLAKT